METGGAINAESGEVYNANDVIPGWKGMKIAQGFKDALGLRTQVDNDVHILGSAETRFAAARRFALSELGDRLLAPAGTIFTKYALPGTASCPVFVAELGVKASIVRAASLVMS